MLLCVGLLASVQQFENEQNDCDDDDDDHQLRRWFLCVLHVALFVSCVSACFYLKVCVCVILPPTKVSSFAHFR